MDTKHFAVLDIGSNSFHLVIAHMDGGTIVVDHRERDILRLGNFSASNQSVISKDNIAKAVTIILKHRQIAESFNCEIKATATSAVRESANRDEFLKSVYEKTGVQIQLISGDEEAAYIYAGVMGLVRNARGKNLNIDIGGGSTELTFGIGDEVKFMKSLLIGAVRCTSLFFPDNKITAENIVRCESYISRQLDKLNSSLLSFNPDTFFGTSGTMRIIINILELKGIVRFSSYGLPYFTASDFANIKAEVFELPKPREILRRYAIEEKRADILPAGLLILEAIIKKFSIPVINYSEHSLREGIILKSILQ